MAAIRSEYSISCRCHLFQPESGVARHQRQLVDYEVTAFINAYVVKGVTPSAA